MHDRRDERTREERTPGGRGRRAERGRRRTLSLRRALAAMLAAAALAWAAPDAARGQAPERRPGHPEVDGSAVVPGTDSSRVWVIRDGVEREGPLQIEELRRKDGDGDALLVQVMRLVGPRGETTDTTLYRLPSLAPVRHRSHASGGRILRLDYGEERVRGELVVPDSAARRIDEPLAGPTFDPGVSSLLLAALPLDDGYEARVPMFNHERLAVVWVEYRVTGSERVVVGGREEAAWVVDVTLWDGRTIRHRVAKSDRRLVSSETEFGNARMVVRPVGG